MNNHIDLNFNFYSDTPTGRDPDSYSRTLRTYHKILWSKPLPTGKSFDLVETKPKAYLHHKSELGEFILGSDAITHSYRNTKRMAHVISQVPPEKVATLFSKGSTIGGYIIFPSNRINNKVTINAYRGMNGKIGDRFDLTLECIRLFYENIENPLSSVFARYTDYFNLFIDFRGYVDFFLLQDLVTKDCSAVKFHLEHEDFGRSPFPKDTDEYLKYRENTISFVEARGKRMANSIK